jgi:ketosteroid isomerase-like protein
MLTASGKAVDGAQIRKLMDDLSEAVRTKDVNASMSNLAPDVLSLWLMDPNRKHESESQTH